MGKVVRTGRAAAAIVVGATFAFLAVLHFHAWNAYAREDLVKNFPAMLRHADDSMRRVPHVIVPDDVLARMGTQPAAFFRVQLGNKKVAVTPESRADNCAKCTRVSYEELINTPWRARVRVGISGGFDQASVYETTYIHLFGFWLHTGTKLTLTT